MGGLHNSGGGGVIGRIARFGLLKGLRSVEIDPEEFRRQLKRKYGLEVADFRNMHRIPVARLDAIAKTLIRDTERLALLEGAGFGLGGMITIIPDAGLLTIFTLRLVQKLCLLYGFENRGENEHLEFHHSRRWTAHDFYAAVGPEALPSLWIREPWRERTLGIVDGRCRGDGR